MRFEEILPALREGKKIRKASWRKGHYFELTPDGIIDQEGRGFVLSRCDLLCNDWEVVKVPTRKIKLRDISAEELLQFQKGCDNIGCQSCPIHSIVTSYCSTKWVDHKDLYSDKFLDQEIEIEVEEDD